MIVSMYKLLDLIEYFEKFNSPRPPFFLLKHIYFLNLIFIIHLIIQFYIIIYLKKVENKRGKLSVNDLEK